jgi:hypothetical protein
VHNSIWGEKEREIELRLNLSDNMGSLFEPQMPQTPWKIAPVTGDGYAQGMGNLWALGNKTLLADMKKLFAKSATSVEHPSKGKVTTYPPRENSMKVHTNYLRGPRVAHVATK